MRKFLLLLILISPISSNSFGDGRIKDVDIFSDAQIVFTKTANIATHTFLGNSTGSTGHAAAMSVATAAALLGVPATAFNLAYTPTIGGNWPAPPTNVGDGLDDLAAILQSATSSNTPSTIVKRDGSGNFSAGTITANLTGNASGSAGSLSTNFTSGLPLFGQGTGIPVSGTVTGNTTKVATSTGAITTGHCASWDSNGNVVDNGANCVSSKDTVVDGGDAPYLISSSDAHVRSGTTLTADRAYTLPACLVGNVGEKHAIKNLPAQTFNIILTAAGGDNVDGSGSKTIFPGNAKSVICAAAGVWDIQ